MKINTKKLGIAAASVAAFTVSAICAKKACTKLEKIKEERDTRLNEIEEALTDESLAEEYSKEDAKNDTKLIKTQATVKSIYAFVPSVACAGVSIVVGNKIGSADVVSSSFIGAAGGTVWALIKRKDIDAEEKKSTLIGGLVLAASSALLVPILNFIRFTISDKLKGVQNGIA